ncbi:Nuclear polyadenylated RNA-binding protein [Yarrowia sp. E02]|nr:Nuclear polyadenylated RNA-binding protein [Yarrowia sp. E02]
MADILKNDDALMAQFEKNVLTRASQVIGSEQDPTLSKYIVMMLLDDYVTEDTIKTEVKQQTGGQLSDDFVAWCRDEMVRVAKPETAFGAVSEDTEMQDEYTVGSMPGRRKTEGAFKGRQDRSAFGGVGKSLKDRVGRNGVSRAFTKEGEYSIKSKGASGAPTTGAAGPGAMPVEMQQAMFATMQNALNMDQSPQERFNHRCRNWPNCNYDNCKFVHPREPCEAFANGGACTAAPGTCLKVHVGQDVDDMANLPPQPEPFKWVPYERCKPAVPKGFMLMPMMTPQGPKQVMMPQVPIPATIMECRFTDRCGNQQCTFGHPTPCNNDAKITDKFSWCDAKEKCEDPACGKNHPSSSLVRENEALPSGQSLEQCKFGTYCTNPKCRFRHATSRTICRNGKECTRLDCYFTHPVNEQCKFGINCANTNCYFIHPEGRAIGTAERKFVNEAEGTEKLIPGQEQKEAQVGHVEVDATME